MKQSILISIPVNGNAAKVTSQSGCAKTDELTPEQKIDVIKSRKDAWQAELDGMAKVASNTKRRKSLGKKIAEANAQIAELKPIKYKDLNGYILDAVKDSVTDFQWRRFVDVAKKKKAADESADKLRSK